MWPQIIGSIATGLTGVIVAVAGLVASRRQSYVEELSRCRAEQDLARRQLMATLRHLYKVERLLANSGARVPERPQELRDLVS